MQTMLRNNRYQAAVAALLLAAMHAFTADYYVKSGGNDSRDGRSIDNAWATIGKVTEFAWSPGFEPGDRILFEGGSSFTTTSGLYLQTDRSTGTAVAPIVIGSYGSGRATIQANASDAIMVWGPSEGTSSMGVRIENVIIRGNRSAKSGPRSAHGILVWNSSSHDMNFFEVENCEIFDFAGDGLAAGRDQGKGRLNNVTIRNVISRDNPGASGVSPHSGSGIVIAGADGARIEHCIAYNNGINNDNPGGPIGIWFWDCINSTIQFCESYNNRTTRGDGGGFDLDGGCQNCVIQYCYSHGNAGAGFLLAQFQGASGYGPLSGNIIRYNISQNDGRKGGFGAISFWGHSWTDRVGPTEVYNNTIFLGATPDNGSPSGIWFLGTNVEGIKIRNNIIVAAGGHKLVNAPTAFATDRVLFQNNCYHVMPGTSFQISWGATTHGSLAAWRASGQERHDGTDVGLQADPILENPGQGGIIGNTSQLHTLEAYRLQQSSPCADAGMDLAALFALPVGTRDFYGNDIPVGGGFAIGAHDIEEPTSSGLTAVPHFFMQRVPSRVRYTLCGRRLLPLQPVSAQRLLLDAPQADWGSLQTTRLRRQP